MKRPSTIAVAAALASTTLTLLLPPTEAEASPVEQIHITETVNVRVAPNLSGEAFTQLSSADPTNIRCAIYGQLIYDTVVWFYSDLADGQRGFWTAYYSDADYWTWADLENRYGITRCEREATSSGGSVYFQPRYHLGDPIAPLSTYTATKDFWSIGGCSNQNSTHWPEHFDGQLVTRASGWSLGRLGITYMLSRSPARAANLNEIILFDPGNLDEYANNPCDSAYDQDQLLADWLTGDSSRRLLVLAGAVTRDASNPDSEGRLHQGIQQHLFPAVREAGASSQVLVCNYDTMGHAEVMAEFGHLAGSGDVTACPGSPDVAWSPGGYPASDEPPCQADFHPDVTVTFGGYTDHNSDGLAPPGDRTTIDVQFMWPADRLRFTECRDRTAAEITLLMGVSQGRHQLADIEHRTWESDLPSFYVDVSTGNSGGHEMSFGTADATSIEAGRWYNASLTLDGALGADEILDVSMNRAYRWSGCPSEGGWVSAVCVSGWTRDDVYGPGTTSLISQVRPQYFDPIIGERIEVF